MTLAPWLQALLPVYGLPALFLAMLVEGPLATVLAGFLAAQGVLGLGQVYLLALLADLLGDSLLYALGRLGRSPLRRQRGPQGRRRRRQLVWLQAHLHQHAARVLIAGKLTHAMGFLVLLAAGAARVPLPAFPAWNLLATLPKAGVLAALGYFGGAAYHHADQWIWWLGCLTAGAGLTLALLWIRYRILPFLPKD